MRKWSELSVVEQLACTYSDKFKFAYGYRPRNDISEWVEEDFRLSIASLDMVILRQNKREELV
jgi:prophage tail gpP-like protein